MNDCIALVVGAGRGERFGGDMPKQYVDLAGEPVIRRTLRGLLDHPGVTAVRAVIHPDHHALYDRALGPLANVPALLDPVIGGASRQDSARNGLESLSGAEPARVLIHDAARPFAGMSVISRVLDALDRAPGAVPALALGDTLKRADARGVIYETVPRDNLYRVQTPQGFHFGAILEAHRTHAGFDLTDDAAVLERAGGIVTIVPGAPDNFKITSPEDLVAATRVLGGGETRTGFGFDVHRFGPGDHVMLLGVNIPFTAGLEGHSDADVGLHALTDALLGTCGGGDIGTHFPPGDDRWQGQSSGLFLKAAADMVTACGGRIVNVDVTIICEAPRVGPYREAMRAWLVDCLGIAPHCVNVKGTTTEQLGFTGRGEGIAAQAVANAVFQSVHPANESTITCLKPETG